MNKKYIIWIIVAVIVIVALYLLFKPSKSSASTTVRTGSGGNVNTSPTGTNTASSLLNSLFPFYNATINKTPSSSNGNNTAFTQTQPVVNGCDANHLDANGFLCVDDGNGGWMPNY